MAAGTGCESQIRNSLAMNDTGSWMVAGLGNPGKKYACTRHNVGFMAAERVAARCGISVTQEKFRNRFGRGLCEQHRVVIARPMAYMNCSGPPLFRLARYFAIPIRNILVIHDDMDIEKGRIKIKEKGGHGGHNGVKSILEAFGSGDFPRLRIGIGRPGTPMDVTDYVLGTMTGPEAELFARVLDHAEDAVMTLISSGVTQAMNQFNHRSIV